MYQFKAHFRLPKWKHTENVTLVTESHPEDISISAMKSIIYDKIMDDQRPRNYANISLVDITDTCENKDSDFIESFEGFPIKHELTKLGMEVYSRDNYRSLGVPKFVIFNKNGSEAARCKNGAEVVRFLNTVKCSTVKPDLAMPITQIVSIKNKIAELSAHGLNANEIAADQALSRISRPELIRVIMSYQRE